MVIIIIITIIVIIIIIIVKCQHKKTLPRKHLRWSSFVVK